MGRRGPTKSHQCLDTDRIQNLLHLRHADLSDFLVTADHLLADAKPSYQFQLRNTLGNAYPSSANVLFEALNPDQPSLF